MTWWDHENESVWTQPLGQALQGPLKGTQLQILPFSLVPWETWLEEHPDTLVLSTNEGGGLRVERPREDYVVGVAIGEFVKAYPYPVISEAVLVNDTIGDIPVVVHANPETRSVHIYVRQLADGTILTFEGDRQQMIDQQTSSLWEPTRGLAIEGELKGQALRALPYISSFDWAWLDFYPTSEFYQGTE